MPPSEPDSAPPLRIGIVGAGRTHQGLGPFLADAFEAVGARVMAVSGRDAAGAARAAAALSSRLGHDVAAAADAASLARAVDALVVASPAEHHLEGLDAALAAGVPCLCEKPLVPWSQAAAGRERVAAFAARGLLLAENCQWPFVLPAVFELYPDLRGRRVRELAMGLGPAFAGAAMLADSLSHVLSVAQALVVIAEGEPRRVTQTDASPAAEHNVVRFELPTDGPPLAVSLHLRRCPEQPRPAWLELDGCRVDRRIGEGYALSFATPDGRARNVRDPLRELVYRFAANLQAKDRERTRIHAADVDVRLRLYAHLVGALAGPR